MSVCYKYVLNKKLILEPYLGYSHLVDYQWYDNSHSSPRSLYINQIINAGGLLKYQIKNLQPKIGIGANRIIERRYYDKVNNRTTYVMKLESKNFIQVQAGLDYEVGNFQFGLTMYKAITYVSFLNYYDFTFAYNQYTLSLTWFPFSMK